LPTTDEKEKEKKKKDEQATPHKGLCRTFTGS